MREKHQKSPRKLLLLGAGFEQIAAIKIAQELGYHVVAFDNQRSPLGAIFADDFHQVDLKSDTALLEAARAVAPQGVFCHAAELAVPVAKVAESLGLAGVGVDTAQRTTDKRLRVDCLSKNGIATPLFHVVEATDPEALWLEYFAKLGAPVVCKPPNLSGARGVELLTTKEEVLSYRGRRGSVGANAFVMEQWVAGMQYSTESILIDGQVIHTAIALRHYDTTLDLRPYLIEDGHSMSPNVSTALRSAIDDVIRRCATALGLVQGVLKGDLIITDNERIVVIEMAARTSGGRFADTVTPRATGVNILYPLIQIAMGDRPNLCYLKPRWDVGVSQRFFFLPAGKIIRSAPKLSLCGQRPGVLEVWFNRQLLNGKPVPPTCCHGDRAGYVICTASTREEADRLALDLVSGHPFELYTKIRLAS